MPFAGTIFAYSETTAIEEGILEAKTECYAKDKVKSMVVEFSREGYKIRKVFG